MTRHRRKILALTISVLMAAIVPQSGFAGEPTFVDYGQPKLLTGMVYEMSSGTNKVLFMFKRTAVRSNATVSVTRDFIYPNGSLAAHEEAVYESGNLVWFQLDERQTGAKGSATVACDAKMQGKQKLLFDWVTGQDSSAKKKTDSEAFQGDTLVGDMISYFIPAHWNQLARGEAVNFRFIAPSRLETVGFKLVKEADVTWRGQPALRLRMEPSSFIIAQIVDPLFFIVEKSGEHRLLEYIGRTTPKMRDGNKWKDLDARTVYDWD